MFRDLFSLAFQGILRKKRSSILIFLVLFISFSSVIVAISLVGSINKTNAEFRRDTYGEWYFAIPSGMEADAKWLEKQQYIETIGVAGNYGTINTMAGKAAFGTIDSNLIDIGRIKLDMGSFPIADDEIAMEADILNALGYNYDLGQEITLRINVPYEDQVIPVDRKFRLSGVIHEYSDLWVLNRNFDNRLLVSAMVTENAAEQVLESARQYITDPQNRELVVRIPQYFLSVEEEHREDGLRFIDGWLEYTRPFALTCENIAAYPDVRTRDYNTLYVFMIAVVTMMAVLCAYIMHMSNEIHSYAVLRSIGITKIQMAKLLLLETLLLVLPAIVLGIPSGAGLTWVGLRLLLYSGSVPIQVWVPFGALLTVVGLWITAVGISRLIMFTVTVNMPLTGRMQLQRNKSRKVTKIRRAMISLLLIVLSFVVIFTDIESVRPAYLRKYWSLCPVYEVWEREDGTVVNIRKTELIGKLPGILRVEGFGEMNIGLSFDGMEEQMVYIYAINEEEWLESFDFSGIQENFHDGKLVMMCFPKETVEEYTLPKDSITLRVYGHCGECSTEENVCGHCITADETDVVVVEVPEYAMNRGLAAFWDPYTIFCSESYVKQLLESMEPGQRWDKYVAGEEFGYDRVQVSVDLISDSLSTDVAMSDLCKENNLAFLNFRQEFQSREQGAVQTLVLLYSAGICIGLVIQLILASTLSLEAEREMHKYRILRAIGMSKRQVRHRRFCEALLRSMTGVIIGWLLYSGYLVLDELIKGLGLKEAGYAVVDTFERNGCDWRHFWIVSGGCMIISLIVMLIAKGKSGKGETTS